MSGGFLPRAILIAAALLPASVLAADVESSRPIPSDVQDAVRATTTAPGKIKETLERCKHCEAKAAPSPKPKPKPKKTKAPTRSPCDTFYDAFYSKPVTDFVVGMGYGDLPDARSEVDINFGLHDSLIHKIQGACEHVGNALCAFRPDPDDATLFTRNVVVKGQSKTVRLRVIKGSADPDKARDAQNAFLDGLKTADAVLYEGHSREGGGPDFSRARFNPKDGHIDYPWYMRNRPGMKAVNKALDASPQRPLKFYGSFSCLSKQHFLKDIQARAPRVALALTTRLTSFAENADQLEVVLNALLTAQCKDGLKSSIMDGFTFVNFPN